MVPTPFINKILASKPESKMLPLDHIVVSNFISHVNPMRLQSERFIAQICDVNPTDKTFSILSLSDMEKWPERFSYALNPPSDDILDMDMQPASLEEAKAYTTQTLSNYKTSVEALTQKLAEAKKGVENFHTQALSLGLL